MKFLAILVAISLVVAISGHGTKDGKSKAMDRDHGKRWAQVKMAMTKCLNPSTANATLTEYLTIMITCAQELRNQTGEAFDQRNYKANMNWFKKNHMRIFACKWQKAGLLTLNANGTATFNSNAVTPFAERFNNTAKMAFTNKINSCIQQKSLPASFNIGERLKPHMECFRDSIEAACGKLRHHDRGMGKSKAVGGSTMATPTKGAESDEFADAFDDVVDATSASP